MEILCIDREYPVDERTTEFFFRPFPSQDRARARVHALSRSASLDSRSDVRTIRPRFRSQFFFVDTVAADLHRYQESIGGRSYLIEVAPVSQIRWRAYIVRIPGIPTALMPFYGPTPAAAARLLCDWLTRAHQQAVAPGPM